MTADRLHKYRTRLRDMADRIRGTAAALEDETRTATGGEAGGSLSNAPLHLGDLGSTVYSQELNATLLEGRTVHIFI